MARGATIRADAGTGGPPTLTKPRLLLVDDEQHVLDGLALHLRRKYDVVTRTSGAAALETIDSGQKFTAVISDLKMPRMSGVELLAEVRHRAPDATRVLLTGYADVTSAISAVNDAGVHCFLTKPCPPAQLARALEEALASTSAARSEKVDEQMTHLGRRATLGTMAGSIGHEIGNLVSALDGSLEMVRQQVERGEMPASEDLGLIGLVKNRLLEHTRALKDLARPQQRKVENLDVAMVVCASVDMLKKSGGLKVARVCMDPPPTAFYVDGDRALLEAVIINLLKNAAEALAEQAEAVSSLDSWDEDDKVPLITVGISRRGDDAVAICIEDNGPGVPEANLRCLFNTYFTTKKSSGGTGLGLAIVRETLAQHGGRVDVESTPGSGAKFTIELPLAGCPPLHDRPHAQASQTDLGGGGSGLRLVPRGG
jgi:signal transduction histidine kinase